MRRTHAAPVMLVLAMTLAVALLPAATSGAPDGSARLADGVLLDLVSGGVYVSGDAIPDTVYLTLVPATIVRDGHEIRIRPFEILSSVGGPDAMGSGASHVCALEDGVTWETADGGCKDLLTGLVWSMDNGGAWSQGLAAQMASDSTEGGVDDWRLPTVEEMETVAAHGAEDHFSGFSCIGSSGRHPRWSSERQGQKHYATNVCTGETDRYWSGGPAISYLGFVMVREAVAPPACNNDGVCDPGENCENCADCPGKQNGPRSGRHCCGNGILEGPEQDGRCGNNP